MMKFVLLSIVSLAILFSIQTIYAEELPLPEGKNVKEWEAISGALMQENRFDEAIIYLDKIIDEESDNLRALSNKAGVLIHLREFEESLKISNKILEIEPNRIPNGSDYQQKICRDYFDGSVNPKSYFSQI